LQPEFIGKGTYFIQNEKYCVLVEMDLKSAKLYSSKAKAVCAVNKLSKSCINVNGNYEIIEIKD